MYNNANIKTCLDNAVGIRQNTNPQFGLIDSGLTISTSGLFVDNSLVTVANIDQALETTDPDYYDLYDNAQAYKAGERIKQVVDDEPFFYEAKIDTTGNPPPTPPTEENTQWIEVDPVSEYLEDVKCDATLEVFNEVYNKKKIGQEVKDIFNNVRLYNSSGRITDKVINEDKLVGFAVQVKDANYLSLVLEKISTQFDENQVSLDIFLYHSSQNDPIDTITLTISKVISSEWTQLTDKILHHNSNDYDTGGTFFICYKQSDLVGQAINKNYDPNRAPCRCNPTEFRLYETWSPWIYLRAFEIDESELPNGTDLWDISKTTYKSDTNYGLNLQISAQCDVTEFICKNTNTFAEAIKLKMEIKIISMIRYTQRTNKTAEKAKNLANIELTELKIDGEDNPNNILIRYTDSIEAMNFDLSNLQTNCMPCTGNKFGVKYNAI